MTPTSYTYLSMCTKTADSIQEVMMVIWTTVVLVPGLEGKLRKSRVSFFQMLTEQKCQYPLAEPGYG